MRGGSTMRPGAPSFEQSSKGWGVRSSRVEFCLRIPPKLGLDIRCQLWYYYFVVIARRPLAMLPLVALKEVTPGPTKERPQSDRVGHMTEQLTPAASIFPLRLSTADSQLFSSNFLSFTLLSKNASANPLVSHTFKTKDLKCPVFPHFQKSGGGGGTSGGSTRGRRSLAIPFVLDFRL